MCYSSNMCFFSYSQRSRIQVWLYEQVNMRIEGCIIVGFYFSSILCQVLCGQMFLVYPGSIGLQVHMQVLKNGKVKPELQHT